MKTFLKKLRSGVKFSEVEKEQLELIRNLAKIDAITSYKNHYYLQDSYVFGKLEIAQNQTGYLLPYDDRFKQDLIIESKDINQAHHKDIVLAKLAANKGKRKKAKIVMIIKPAFETSLVYTESFKGVILGVNLKTGLTSALKASQKALKAFPLNTVLKIDNLTNDIVEVLGNLNDAEIDEKISLSLFNKHDEFSKDCENQAKSFGNFVDAEMYLDKRKDLRALDFCTIDPNDAKDFDDAIYYDEKERILYVAIADVSEYVQAYSPIDKEAKFRGFSIYFPHKAIPMLPRKLSENICSLKPKEDRLAFIFKIYLDENFSVIKDELFEGIINSKRRFTYDEVDEYLKNKNFEENFTYLSKLYEITKIIKARRLKIGFDFRTEDLRITINEKGELLSTKFEASTPSHALIEDCMLLANQAAASRIPKGIFRNHAPADLAKIYKLLEDLAAFGIDAIYESNLARMISKIQAQAENLGIREEVDKLIIKAQKRAEYASENHGHFGLGFKSYSHFTSPIRRYSDLLLHRLLKAKLAKDEKYFSYLLLNIEETCFSLNDLEREADKVAYDFVDRKFARWAEKNIGKSFLCFISENDKIITATLNDELKGARIFLSDFAADLLSPVKVQITSANIAQAKIFGKIVEKL